MSGEATFTKTPPRPPPVSFREVSGRQRALVANVIERCGVIKTRVSKELKELHAVIQSKTVENVSRVVSPLRSGVGIVLQGCMVDSFVPGVPASRVLRKGDMILAIDGEEVNETNIAASLTGSDTPGSAVTISYKQPEAGSVPKDLVLTRMPAETFSDRKNLLELLRQMKGSACARQDETGALLVDQALDLWQKMCVAEQDVRTQVMTESHDLAQAAQDMMIEMGDAVEKLHSMYDLERFITEQEFLQKQVPLLEDQIQRLMPETEHLAQEVNSKKAALNSMNLEIEAAKTEIGALTDEIGSLKRRLLTATEDSQQKVILLSKENEKNGTTILQLLADVARLQKELKAQQSAHDELVAEQAATYNSSLAALKTDIERLQEEVKQLNDSQVTSRRHVEEVERRRSDDAARHKESLAELQQHCAALQEELEASGKNEKTQRTRISELLSLHDTYMATIEELRKAEARLRSKAAQLHADNTSQGLQISDLRKQLASANADAHKKALMLTSAEGSLHMLSANAAAQQEEYEQKLKESSSALIRSQEEAHKLEVELDAHKLDLASAKREIGSLSDEHTDLLLKFSSHKTKAQGELEEVLFDAGKTKETLTKEVQAFKDAMVTANSSIALLDKALSVSKADLASALETHSSTHHKLTACEKEKTALKVALELAQREAASFKAQATEATQQIEMLEEGLRLANLAANKAEEERTQLESKLEARASALAAALESVKAGEAKHDSTHKQLMFCRRELAARELDVEHVRKLLSDSHLNVEAGLTKCGTLTEALSKAKDEFKAADSERVQVQNDLSVAKAELKTLRHALDAVLPLKEELEAVTSERDRRVPAEEMERLTLKYTNLVSVQEEVVAAHRQVLDNAMTEQKMLAADAVANKEAYRSETKAHDALKAEFAAFMLMSKSVATDLGHSRYAVSELLQDKSAKVSEVEQLKTHVNGANDAAAALRAQLTELRAQVQQLESSKRALEAEFKEQVRTLQAELVATSSQLEQKASTLDASQRDFQVSQTALADAQAQLLSVTENLEAAVKGEEVLVRARRSLREEIELVKRDLDEKMELLNSSLVAQENLRIEAALLRRQLASTKKELESSELELQLSRRQLHDHRTELRREGDDHSEARRALIEAEGVRDGLQIELDALKVVLDKSTASLVEDRAKVTNLSLELTSTKGHLASVRTELDKAACAADASVKQRDKLREENGILNADLKQHISLLRDSEERHSKVLNKHDALQRTHVQTVKVLTDTEKKLQAVTQERDQVVEEHSKCKKKQICGIGISVWDPDDDGLVEVKEVIKGMSCWLETQKNPDDVLPEANDRIKLINSRLITNVDMCDGLMVGEEGTVCEIVIDKADGSGVFTCHIVRRPRM